MTTYDKPRPAGHPSWFDLMSPDIGKAAAFYRKLFGWTYTDSGPDFGHYHMAHARGRNAAGIGQSPEGSDTPSAWTVYYAADDADAMTAKARELGATIMTEPFEVPGQGRMAIIQDPTGAVFGLWQPLGHIGAGIADSHGAMTWCEAVTPGAEAASAFYGELFGATVEPMEGTPSAYYMLKKDSTTVGGVMQLDGQWQNTPPHWMAYFQVDDVDRAVRIAQEAGGTVSVGPFATPYGRMAVLSDPFGAVFSVIRPPAPA